MPIRRRRYSQRELDFLAIVYPSLPNDMIGGWLGLISAVTLMVLGPTVKFAVPGFWDVSLLWGKEKNHCGLGAPG